jgi:hypothetical protein
MNPFVIPVIFGTFIFFLLGIWLAKKAKPNFQKVFLSLVATLAAIPSLLFVIYYTGIFGEAMWFYSFRAIPGTEFSACGMGLLAGWLQAFRNRTPRLNKRVSAGFIPFIATLCVTIPYLKGILLRPDWNKFEDEWSGNVCLQSSESSCGPASAATVLKFFGMTVSEKQIAQEAFTSRRGTENWYLIRAIRRHGLVANYALHKVGDTDFSFPSIIGVRLGDESGSGHFITVLGKEGGDFLIGDPLGGLHVFSEAQVTNHYYLTGFCIVVTTNQP